MIVLSQQNYSITSTSHPLFFSFFLTSKPSEEHKRCCRNSFQICPIAVALKRLFPYQILSFNSENENALSPFNVTSSHWLGEKIDGAHVTKTGSDKVQGFWLDVRWVCVIVNVMCDVGSVSEYTHIYIFLIWHGWSCTVTSATSS